MNKEPITFSLDDLKLMTAILNKCAIKGIFEISEYATVAYIAEKISKAAEQLDSK